MKPGTLQQAVKFFSDEQVCIDAVAHMRWSEGVACPACGHPASPDQSDRNERESTIWT
jgi:hypothetical protein